MDLAALVERVGAALLVGALIGLDRDFQRKPAGVRTHALVCIGSAAVVLATLESGGDAQATSRVIQGLVAGVGFLGAGVIIHHRQQHRVEGLTTAASIWMAAGLGAACGLGPLERAFARRMSRERIEIPPGR